MASVVGLQTNIRSAQQVAWPYTYLASKAAPCSELLWSPSYITVHVERTVVPQKIHVRPLSPWQPTNQKARKSMILHSQMCITSCFLPASKLAFKSATKSTAHAGLPAYLLPANERPASSDPKHVKSNPPNQCRRPRNPMWGLISFGTSDRVPSQSGCYNSANEILGCWLPYLFHHS